MAEEKKIKCPACGKEMKDQQELDQHRKSHERR